jgi:exopolysaccharide biosynthesis polyprenyl glycosylphosphotransferase
MDVKKSELFFKVAQMPVDAAMILASFMFAYFLRAEAGFLPVSYIIPLDQYLHWLIIIVPLWLVIFAINGLYSLKRGGLAFSELASIFTSVTVGAMLVLAILFVSSASFFSRLLIVYAWIASIILVIFGRLLVHGVQRLLYAKNIGVHRVVIIGNNEISKSLIQQLNNRFTGFRVIGVVNGALQKGQEDIRLYKSLSRFLNDNRKDFDEVIQADPRLTKNQVVRLNDFCEKNQKIYRFVPDLTQVRTANVEISALRGVPMVEVTRTPLQGWRRLAKRIVDIIGSLIAIVVFSPIMILAAIAIKLDSEGTVLWMFLDNGRRVKRVGKAGELFQFYKFRSMFRGTHRQRYAKLKKKNIRRGPLLKIKHDPRVTKVGRFIRKYSIDELPQLFNVLLGNMSLVGPRPHLPEEVKKYEQEDLSVLVIKPGITGLAQVSGRSDLSFDDEMRLDLYYIENWSLSMDFQILLKTPLAIFSKRKVE